MISQRMQMRLGGVIEDAGPERQILLRERGKGSYEKAALSLQSYKGQFSSLAKPVNRANYDNS